MPLFVPGARDGSLVGEAVVRVHVGGVATQVVAVLMAETKVQNKGYKMDQQDYTLKVAF